MKTCNNCGISGDSIKWKPAGLCNDCHNAKLRSRRRRLKLWAIEFCGGKCQHCGYNKYFGALDFHHKDPKEKDFQISRLNGWEVMTESRENMLKNELNKCILLCKNCHRKEHYRLSAIDRMNL